MTTFNDLGLRPELIQALEALNYHTPTDIQSQMIPVMLTGVDVIGQAQTGTGKTAAFALPILQNLTPGQKRPQALILAPTRELALQVAEAIQSYAANTKVRVLAVYGGASYMPQLRSLKQGVDIVVGTPGRLLDLLKRKALDLSDIRTLVLDEADEMLSMGFIEDIQTLLNATPENRQMALFSATLPKAIRQLAQKYLREPQSVTIQRKHLTVAAVEQRYYLVNQRDKLAALIRLLEMEDASRALIFVRTRASSGTLANALASRGYPAEMLNGDLSQDARERVMSRFRNNQFKVLVATDVAARGLDIDDISHVFNYDLPEDPEIFVHRIGRTGRAGKDGIAISLITPRERGLLRRIEGYTRQKQAQSTLPQKEDIERKRRNQALDRVEVWLKRGRYKNEAEMVAEMMEKGYPPEEIAAAALRLVREYHKQRPVEAISPVETQRPRPRRQNPGRKTPLGRKSGRQDWSSSKSHESGMVRLSLDKGKAHGMRPGDVVGMLAYHADIPGRVIGAIHITEEKTLVDVPEQFVDRILNKNGSYSLRKTKLAVQKA